MSEYPSDWRECLLGEVVEKITSGGTPKADNPDLYGGDIPFLKIDDITSSSKYLRSHKVTINERGLSESSAKIVPTGTLLLTMYGTIGRCCITTYPVATNQAIASFLGHPEVELEYLYYALESKADEFSTASSQTTQANISAGILKQTPIAIPPLPEQKKIAEILSGIDLLYQGIKAKINKLKEVRNALIENLELGSSGEWVALSKISDFVTSGSRGWSQYYSESGSKFVRIGNLSRDSIDLDPAPDKWQLVAPPEGAEGARTKLKEGDILISITADLGICCIYSAAIGEAYINQHIALVRVGSGHIGYSRQIAYYICSDHCQEQIRSMNDSGAKAGLNLDSIRRIRVPLIQGGTNNRFVRSIDALQSAISGNFLRLQHLAYEKSSLTSDLLSGRKRVNV